MLRSYAVLVLHVLLALACPHATTPSRKIVMEP